MKTEKVRKWHQRTLVHPLVCPVRSRWRRHRYHQPFWRDDKTANMLGIGQTGCHRCGRDCVIPPATTSTEETRHG